MGSSVDVRLSPIYATSSALRSTAGDGEADTGPRSHPPEVAEGPVSFSLQRGVHQRNAYRTPCSH